jgi:hypothetical protein
MTSLDLDRHLDRSKRQPGHYTWLARIPFLVFSLGGMVGLIVLKYFVIDQFIICGVAAALILVYAVSVASIPALRIREDQLGDNCYYLGFLYTLTSLGWALYKFAQFNDIADIISNFGLALISTVVGIMARVVINQARKDVLETERDARMMLTESMVAMRVQLDDAVIALKSFCAQTQQIAGDAIRENAERANSALEQSVAKIGDTSNIVLTRIEQAFDEFNENTKKLNQVAAGTVKALEKLINRLETMEPPSDLISRRLDAVMESAEKAGNLLRERLEADERAISEAASRMKDMEERLKSAAGWISAAGSGLGGVAETSMRAVNAAEAASQKLGSLTSTMANAIAEQERLIASTRTNSELLNGALIDTQKRMAEQAKESLETLFTVLRAHNDAMAAELDRTRRMTSDTGTALADMTDRLTERVREIKSARPLGDAAE